MLQEERSRVRAGLSYSRTLTRRFFGFGDDTDEDDETSFTDEFAFAGVGHRHRAAGCRRRPRARRRRARRVAQPRGAGTSTTRGRPKDVLPRACSTTATATGSAGSDLELRWDTRDSEILPYRGFDVGARIDAAPVQSEGNAGSIFGVFGSKFIPVPGLFHSGGTGTTEEHPPTDTVALHLETETTAGELPFYSLPSLGGAERGRGFIEGRFRDRSLWAATAEYRFWVIPRGFALSPWTPHVRVERLGLALFYDVGSVADEWWDLFSADAEALGRHRLPLHARAERAVPRRRRVLGRGAAGDGGVRAELLSRPGCRQAAAAW